MSDLLTKLGLPQTTTLAKYHLRLDDRIVIHDAETAVLAEEVGDPSCFCAPGEGFYRNSFTVKRLVSGEFKLTSVTIQDGAVKPNFSCRLSQDSEVISGFVNVFFGSMAIDQGYIDELLEELVEMPIAWDVIECSYTAESPEVKEK